MGQRAPMSRRNECRRLGRMGHLRLARKGRLSRSVQFEMKDITIHAFVTIRHFKVCKACLPVPMHLPIQNALA
jgi:hypothetical protein